MKVMVIVKASKSSEAGEMPSEQLLTEMGRYNEELAKAGIMLDGAGLHPSSKGVRVQFSGGNRTVIDGPFAETKELIAGFWMWRVKSMAEAVEWAKRCPCPQPGEAESHIELRQVFEAEDFGESFTPELREQEAAVMAMTLGLSSPTFQDGPEMVIAGINRSYNAETRAAIPEQWHHFIPILEAAAGLAKGPCFGVCWNTKSACDFDYLTGVAVTTATPLPPEFTTLKLASQRYAVFAHTKHVSAIPQTIDTIWSKWAPDCGLKVGGAPCFERYTSEFNPETGLGGMEIWIPLQ